MKQKEICGIYKITSPSNKIYIGQSVNILKRWNKYKNNNCKQQNLLYRSLIKYGADLHKFEIIIECKRFELNEKEKFYIEKYNSFESKSGLNLQSGGVNYSITKNQKNKISLFQKGKIVSIETKRKMSNSAKNVKKSDSHKMNISISKKGKTHTEETRIKVSLAKQNTTNETKNKISLSLKGRSFSKKHIENMKLARSRKVLDTLTGNIYNTITEASKHSTYSRSSIASMLLGERKNYTNFIKI